MTVWMLSQFYQDPDLGLWPVAASYSNGHVCPQNPTDPNGWALVRCDSSAQQIEAASQDPRVRPYRTSWDIVGAETVTAYQGVGATQGMLLGQLLRLLASLDPGYMTDF